MRIGEVAARADVSVKAMRYYERLGLIAPARRPNGYREFDESHVRTVAEIRELVEVASRRRRLLRSWSVSRPTSTATNAWHH